MVRVIVGDLFKSRAQTLVNTVNCVGVMGKGIALEFKKQFPDMFDDYAERCRRGLVRLGEPYLFRRLIPPWILNFPTKDDWRSLTRLSDIEAGLRYLADHCREWGIESLAVPPLGCGNGQLEWRVVGPTLYRYLRRLEISVELYAPYGTAQQEIQVAFLNADPMPHEGQTETYKINPAWIALVEIVARIARERYHWPIGRTTFQKIAYFATQAGIPTGLTYQRDSFGPFTSELNRISTLLSNNALLQEKRLGRMFALEPGRTYFDAAKRFRSDLAQWEQQIDSIADLFARMRTLQAELAATAHFAWLEVRKHKPEPSEQEILDEVKRWKRRRKPPLSDEDIIQTLRDLTALGWLRVSRSSQLPGFADEFTDA
jgi:O-acetyl-ADP-ribose deacetylase (regulator of RNase III)/uncharacterized protein YwgA